jgi:hypothetical protein
MSAEPKYTNPVVNGVVELTPEEVAREFDAEARRSLGISGEEFRRRWQAGEYAGQDNERVWRVAFFLGGLSPDD